MILVGFTVFLSQLRADVNKVLVESIGDAWGLLSLVFRESTSWLVDFTFIFLPYYLLLSKYV